jgi:Planctomycete cytochrome C/WD domain, G-beta repeat
MRSRFFLCLPALLLPAAVFAADDPKPIAVVELTRKEAATYGAEVEPILNNKCSSCHNNLKKEGKLDMSTYEMLTKGGSRGSPIIPGASAGSLLVKLCGRTEKPFMPPRKETPLTPEELALIKLWIDQGAKAPSGPHERPKVIVSAPPAGVQPVRGIAVSPDKSAVAASRGNQIHIYDAGSGAYVRSLTDPDLKGPDMKPVQAAHLSLVEAIAYSPDGKLIASGAYQEVILWDAQTGSLRKRITGFADRVGALAFSSNGKLLATGGGAPTEDGEVKVFDPAAGTLVFEIKNGHSDTVYGVSFSPDDKVLATCGADKFVKTWEVPSGKLLKVFEGHTHHVLDVGWKSDGKFLASCGADNSIKVWDWEKGEQARTIPMPMGSKQLTRLLFIGKKPEFLTVSGDDQIKVWNVDGGNNTRSFGAGGTDFLYAVGVSPDGAVVAAGGEEGVVRLFKGDGGQLIKELLPPGVAPPVPPAPAKK